MQLRASPGLKIMQKTTSEQLLTLGMLSMRWGGGLSAQAMYCCYLLDNGEGQWKSVFLCVTVVQRAVRARYCCNQATYCCHLLQSGEGQWKGDLGE